MAFEPPAEVGGAGGGGDGDSGMIKVIIVHIPALARHLAAGWSEDQLLSGRVHTVGRTELDVRLARGATLLQLAQAVEDAWGVDVRDQAGSARYCPPRRRLAF